MKNVLFVLRLLNHVSKSWPGHDPASQRVTYWQPVEVSQQMHHQMENSVLREENSKSVHT
uniref:Uncharacterized protein n=1 Tax=Arion vulgaris TaxID=1028688 RepID=A0A0B7A2U7_9EUPU